MGSAPFIGRSVTRIEDDVLLRGKAKFLDDLPEGDALHAAFLRSPVAHGRIRHIDMDEARAMPGVAAILTFQDLSDVLVMQRMPLQFFSNTLPPDITPYPLAKDEVLFVGEAIAIVLADSRARAEDAVGAIGLDIEDLSVVADPRVSASAGAPKVASYRPDNLFASFRMEYGAVDTAFDKAAHRVALPLVQHRGAAHSMEGRGAMARPSGTGELTVWLSTQQSHEARGFLVEMLGLDETQINVIAPAVGGGFGAKYLTYPEEVTVAAAALKLDRAVKWVEDRREHFLAAVQERDQFWEIEAACDAQGKLLGIRGSMIHDGGAYVPQGINVAFNAATALPGPYVLPNYRMEVKVAATNKVATLPVRGAGYPEGTFCMERALDALAEVSGLDRVEIRMRNLVTPDLMPYVTPLKTRAGTPIAYDSGDFPVMLQGVLDDIDWQGFPERRLAAERKGLKAGIAVACGMKGTGRGPYESATVRIGKSGKVTIITGAMAMGQGLHTVMAQIAAESLGVQPEDIAVISGNTSSIPLGLGGFASRQTVAAGNAMHNAAQGVRKQILLIASEMLEAAAEDIELVDGMARVAGTERAVSLQAIAREAYGSPGYALPKGAEPGLEVSDNYMPTGLTYGMGAHAAEVHVDEETGAVQVVRYAVVNDCGRAINPMLVEGQIHGGVVHGLGNALFEYMGYDDQAQPTTTTLADYLLVSAPEVPRMSVRIVEYPSPKNPLGVKGVGEAGCLPVAAVVASAVEDALGRSDVLVRKVPLGPQDLFELLRAG